MIRAARSLRPFLPFLFLLAAAAFAAGQAVTSVRDLSPLFPRQSGPWKAGEDDELYPRDGLYDYMDGGAEVFLDFAFREVLVRRFAGPNENELVVDVYDMGSPDEAYGIFSCDRQGKPLALGDESEFGDGLLRVRKGRFFLTIMTMFEDPGAETAILELGRALVPKLGPAGPPPAAPALVRALPAAGLRAGTAAYFHSAVNLNPRYFVSAENVLALSPDTSCALGEYDRGGGRAARLLLVRYPSAALAAAARESFLKAYVPGASASGSGLTPKGWVATRLSGAALAVVFEAPDEAWAAALLARVPNPIP